VLSIHVKHLSSPACTLALIALLFPLQVGSAFAAEGNCWVVAIAMNQDAKTSEHWNQYGEEFARVFIDHAKPLFNVVQAKTVLGREARYSEIVKAVRWLHSKARKGDLVAFYITAHGGTERKQGWGVDVMDGKTIWGRELKEQAAQLPCSVLFVIDSCQSGGFAREFGDDIPLPPNCAAICSSRFRQSTTNVLNIALNEALWGIADTDTDNVVELDELIRYIEHRARKIAPPGESLHESEMPVIVVGDGFAPDQKLTQVSGKLSAILHQGQWYLGRVNGEEDGKVNVHIMGCNDNPDYGFFVLNQAPKARVFPLDDDAPRPVLVKNVDDDETRPALWIGKGEKGQAIIRYVPGKRAEDEPVERSRIRLAFPDRVRINE
jgi:Caspase domain